MQVRFVSMARIAQLRRDCTATGCERRAGEHRPSPQL